MLPDVRHGGPHSEGSPGQRIGDNGGTGQAPGVKVVRLWVPAAWRNGISGVYAGRLCVTVSGERADTGPDDVSGGCGSAADGQS